MSCWRTTTCCGIESRPFSRLAGGSKYDVEKPYAIEFKTPLGNEELRRNLDFEMKIVNICDLRLQKENLKPEEHGCEVVKIPVELASECFNTTAPQLCGDGRS